MSDRDGWHRDSKGNEHFYAHDAEWANRDIREQAERSSSSSAYSSDSSGNAQNVFQIILMMFGGVCLSAGHKLWVIVVKSMKGSGFTPVVSDRVGMAAGIALVALGAALVWKTPSYIGKSVVTILYTVIAGFLIF